MLPVAFGANGQPPIPPALESSTPTPSSTAANAFAKPVLRVLWKWYRSRGVSPTASRIRAVSSRTWLGTPTPMVSPRASSCTPERAASTASATTRSTGTSPSNGQPNATDRVSVVSSPASRAPATTSAACRIASAVGMFWLRPENVSVTPTTAFTSSTPVRSARSRPRRLSTSPAYDTPGRRGTRSITASASAIAGTSFGCANETASTRVAPASTSRVISSTFAPVDRITDSFCSPSRGLTSTMAMSAGTPAGYRRVHERRALRRADRRSGPVRCRRRLPPAGRVPGQDVRDPRGPRRPGRHLGPVPLPGGALGLRHAHLRVRVPAVGGGPDARRRRLDPGVRPGDRRGARRREGHPVRASRGCRVLVRRGCAVDGDGPAGLRHRDADLRLLVRLHRLLPVRRGLPAGPARRRGLRRPAGASAELAGRPGLRRQAGGGDRQRRDRGHPGPGDGRRGRARDHAAALTDVHRVAAEPGRDLRGAAPAAAGAGRRHGRAVEERAAHHRHLPARPAPAAADEAADPGRRAQAVAGRLPGGPRLRPPLRALGPADVLRPGR